MKKQFWFLIVSCLFLIGNIYAQTTPMYNLRATISVDNIQGNPCGGVPYQTSISLNGLPVWYFSGNFYNRYYTRTDDMTGGFSINQSSMMFETNGAKRNTAHTPCDYYDSYFSVRKTFNLGDWYKNTSYFTGSYQVGDYSSLTGFGTLKPCVFVQLISWPQNLAIQSPVSGSLLKLYGDTKQTITATPGFPADAYNWTYQIVELGSVEQPYNAGYGQSTINFSGTDIFGSNFELLAAATKKVTFKLYYKRDNGVLQSTESVTYNLTLKASQIVGATPQMALCNESTTTNAVIKFDKKIGSNRKLEIMYSKVGVNGTTPLLVRDSDLNSNNEYLLKNVPSTGDYQIKVSRYVNEDDSPLDNYEVQPTILNFSTGLFPPKLESSLDGYGIYCFGGHDGKLTAKGKGGTSPYTFTYKKGGAAISTRSLNNANAAAFMQDADVTNLDPGTYSLVLTDKNGCTVNPDKSLQLNQPITAYTLSSKKATDATGYGLSTGAIEIKTTGGTIGSASITPNGYVAPQLKDSTGKSYPATFVSRLNGVVTYSFSNLPARKYTIRAEDMGINGRVGTISDSAGCLIKDVVQIIQPPKISLKISEKKGIICYGESTGSLNGNVKGGVRFAGNSYPYQYTWAYSADGSVAYKDLSGSDSTISQKVSGYYRLTVTDKNGISNSGVYILKQPLKVDYQLSVKNVTCSNFTDGAATFANIKGGFKPYTVLWSNDSTGAKISSLAVGKYSLTVTDSAKCSVVKPFQVKDTLNSIIIKQQRLKLPQCSGYSDGELSIALKVDSPPYTFKWNTGSTDTLLINLRAGEYTVQVTDNKKCIKEALFKVPEPGGLTLSLGEDRYLCKGQKADFDLTVPDSNYTYQWFGQLEAKSAKISVSEDGRYVAKITNKKGCSVTDDITIYKVNQTVLSDFVVPTQVFAGEEVSVVNITQAGFADTSYWQVPSTVTVKDMGFEYATVVFPDTGVYQLSLRSILDKCVKVNTKQVKVLQPSFQQKSYNGASSFIEDFEIMPNPSDGHFQVKIKLQETASVKLKLMDFISKGVITEVAGYDKNEYLIPMDVKVAPSTYILLLETTYGSRVLKVVIL